MIGQVGHSMLRNGSVGAIRGSQLNASSYHAGKLFLDLSASDAGTIIGQVGSLVFCNNCRGYRSHYCAAQ